MNNSCDLVDRISDFPDSILGLILSNLPTKQAVATSILSKRWQFGWVTIHNLDFCCCNGDEIEGANTEFVRFVNRVLLQHDARFLFKFRLVWQPGCVSSHVSSWITTVIAKNVNELYMCLGFQRFDIRFDCAWLQSLKFYGSIFVSAAAVFCLPKLKSLELVGGIDFESEETFEKLINGCPVLDDLFINTVCMAFTYRIFSTSLRSLTFMCDCGLKLEADSLEYLEVSDLTSGILVLKNLSSLVEAYIRVFRHFSEADECNSIVEVIRASKCAKFLTLSADVTEALRCATISLSTEFRRLVQLKTEIECCPWSLLQDFIQNSDNLEVLTIWQDLYDENSHDHHTSHDPHSTWTTPIKVPRCLSNSLKKVYIYGYKGMEDEHGMILYMLEHGRILEVMKVSCENEVSDGEKSELLQKIRESPKKSSACELELR